MKCPHFIEIFRNLNKAFDAFTLIFFMRAEDTADGFGTVKWSPFEFTGVVIAESRNQPYSISGIDADRGLWNGSNTNHRFCRASKNSITG